MFIVNKENSPLQAYHTPWFDTGLAILKDIQAFFGFPKQIYLAAICILKSNKWAEMTSQQSFLSFKAAATIFNSAFG